MGGYSARYHAASLAAVFLAPAIGILIGVGFGDDVISGTTEDLEESLQNDVERQRERTDELRELNRERAFSEAVYPALPVGGGLRGERVADRARRAAGRDRRRGRRSAEPAGARLTQVAVVREPPDLTALADQLGDTRYSRLRRDSDDLLDFARAAGRGLVLLGEGVVRRVRAQLLTRFSGRPHALDAVVLTRDAPEDRFRRCRDQRHVRGRPARWDRRAGRPAVGVERTDAERSIELFASHDLSTVDNVDLVAGRVAPVSVLGADGSFGVKDSADELLPDLISPAGRTRDEIGASSAARLAALAVFTRPRGGAGSWPGPGHAPRRARARELVGAASRSPPGWCSRPSRSSRWLKQRCLTTAPTSTCSIQICAMERVRDRGRAAGAARRLAGAAGRPTPRAGGASIARALTAGRFSTGAIKAVGAFALAAYAVSGRWREELDYLADLALLLLATNLFNLLDLRPGRVEKVFALIAGLCFGAWTAELLELLGVFIGPVVVGAWSAPRAGDARRHGLEPDRALAGISPGDARGPGAADRAGGGRGTQPVRRVLLDHRGDRACSAAAPTRLAGQSSMSSNAGDTRFIFVTGG